MSELAAIQVERTTVVPAVPVYPEWLEAAEIIRRRGWIQGAAGTSNGPVCLLGALKEAHGICPEEASDWWNHGRGFFHRAKRATGFEHPAAWNDAPGRTQAEVIDLLERVGWLG